MCVRVYVSVRACMHAHACVCVVFASVRPFWLAACKLSPHKARGARGIASGCEREAVQVASGRCRIAARVTARLQNIARVTASYACMAKIPVVSNSGPLAFFLPPFFGIAPGRPSSRPVFLCGPLLPTAKLENRKNKKRRINLMAISAR